MLKAKAAAYEAAAQADTQYAAGYLEVASMFLEALGKADDMSEDAFAAYAMKCVFAAYQWEDRVGPDAFVPEYQYDTP
jgi:hypothetical protein